MSSSLARFSRNQPLLFESEPAVADGGGGYLVAWVQWEPGGLDRVVAAWPERPHAGEPQALSADDASAGHPQVCGIRQAHAALSPSSGGGSGTWAVWEECRNGRWAVVGCEWDPAGWRPERLIAEDAFDPALCEDRSGDVWCAFVRLRGARRSLHVVNVCQRPAEPIIVPTLGMQCYRPRLTSVGQHVWVTWEGYLDGAYRVFGCPVGPHGAGSPLMLSHGPGDNVRHTTCADGPSGLWVAWIDSCDVADGDGVVDQQQCVQAARMIGRRWESLPEATELSHGMLVNAGAGGYLGSRRKPMLVAGGDRVWVLWERKDLSDGHTRRAVGILCGKWFDGDGWSSERELMRGLLSYTLAPSTRDGFVGFVGFVARDAQAGADWDSGVSNVFEDAWGSLVVGEIELSADAPEFEAEVAKGWQVVALAELSPATPRQQVAIGEDTLSLYWGDPHFHTAQTGDAEGEVDELLHYLRDKARLDFGAVCDNDVYCVPLTEHAWARQHRLIAEHSEPGRFVVIPAHEWSWADPETKKPNHRLVLFAKTGEPLWHQVDAEGRDIEALAASIERTSGLLIGHHLGWVFADSPVDSTIEVVSAWSPHMVVRPGVIHEYLATGRRLGFTGGSDSHRRNPGLCGALTGVYAPELTAEALVEGIRRRRTIATTGTRIAMELRIGDAFIGDDVRLSGHVPVRARVVAPRPIESLAVVRDGEVISSVGSVGETEAALEFDERPLPGTHWYYASAILAGEAAILPNNLVPAQGNHAWTSPIWVTA